MSIKLDLLDLRTFIAVFDFNTFHTAAEFLNLSQPALSRRLRTMELRIGSPLFERSTRNVKPTTTGKQLEPIVRRLLDELDSSILAINGRGDRHEGLVTISSIPS